jgi:dolichol-phosphate mannosyltransferase
VQPNPHDVTLDLSLVVPTYNERGGIAELAAAVFAAFQSAGISGELIIVDDNSPDGTGALADVLSIRYPLRVVHRPRKLGLGSAVMAGFGVASAPVLGAMDADLSHPPDLLPRLLALMRGLQVDAVVGSRYITGGTARNWPLRRHAMSRLGCLLARPLTPVRDATSGVFLIRRDAVRAAAVRAGGFKICLELLLRGQVRSVAEVPYDFVDRTTGASKMTVREAVHYFTQLLHLYALKLRGRCPRPRYVKVPSR